MSTATPAIAPATNSDFCPESTEHSVVLYGVTWETYLALRDAEENNRLRMTFDEGALEIMSPSGKHAKVSYVLGCMIYEWAMLHRIKTVFGGDMTFRKANLKRGVEADHCYWISQQAAVFEKDEIDLFVDPPPDLALEIEVSRSSVPKLPIYQALGVPEIWRWSRSKIEILALDSNHGYESRLDSNALPGFPFRLAEEFVERRHLESVTELMHHFRKAISQRPQA